jgi:hypothetical protein
MKSSTIDEAWNEHVLHVRNNEVNDGPWPTVCPAG